MFVIAEPGTDRYRAVEIYRDALGDLAERLDLVERHQRAIGAQLADLQRWRAAHARADKELHAAASVRRNAERTLRTLAKRGLAEAARSECTAAAERFEASYREATHSALEVSVVCQDIALEMHMLGSGLSTVIAALMVRDVDLQTRALAPLVSGVHFHDCRHTIFASAAHATGSAVIYPLAVLMQLARLRETKPQWAALELDPRKVPEHVGQL